VHAVEATGDAREPGRQRALGERAVALVAEQPRLATRRPIGDEHVEVLVAVEVLDGDTAGGAVGVEPDVGRHVREPRERAFRGERSRRQAVLGRHAVGKRAERHVGDVEQPHRRVVPVVGRRGVAQYLDKAVAGAQRALALRVLATAADRQDAGLHRRVLAAVLGLAEPQAGDAQMERHADLGRGVAGERTVQQGLARRRQQVDRRPFVALLELGHRGLPTQPPGRRRTGPLQIGTQRLQALLTEERVVDLGLVRQFVEQRDHATVAFWLRRRGRGAAARPVAAASGNEARDHRQQRVDLHREPVTVVRRPTAGQPFRATPRGYSGNA
jgi:hypothetical protein